MTKQDQVNEVVWEILDAGGKPSPTGIAREMFEQIGSSKAATKVKVERAVKYYEAKGLLKNCEENGIPIDNVTQYWHKSKHYSVFVKNQPKSYEDIRDELVAEMQKYSPSYPKIKRNKSKDGHLLVIDIADLHINKYCESFMTGHDYNSKMAADRALEGAKGVLTKSSGFKIDKIVFVVGNDILNTDNTIKSTTRGTLQDTDVHWYTAFQIAKDCYIKCIEYCMQFADVEVVHCPSNHDEISSCFLADTLQSWFRKSKNISFDISPNYRKYYRYHENLIELEHGHKGKMNNLPLVMAQEQPKMWAETKYRYCYLHHVHHQDKTQFKSSKDYIGVNVTYLRSPSPPDIWHAEQQYINMIAIEGFVHSKKHGRVSHITHYF